MFWQSSCLVAVPALNGRKGKAWDREQVNTGHLLLPQTVSICRDGGGPENPHVSGGSELCRPLSCHPNSPTSEKNWRRLSSSRGLSAFW